MGMAIIGFILRLVDVRILNRWDTFTVLFYLLFGRFVTTIVSTSVVNIFVMFTRDLLLMAIIAYVLARLSNLNNSTHKKVLVGGHLWNQS